MKVFPESSRKEAAKGEGLRTWSKRLALILVFVCVFVFFFKIVFF